MLRWTEDQLREHHAKRQSRAEAMQEAKQHQAEPKRPKYRNKKTAIGGRVFDSKAEAARFVELTRQQEAGLIFGLQCQVPFTLEVNGQLICKYIADFVYINEHGSRVVEDVKSRVTERLRDYVIKKKLMKAIHGITVKEVRKTRKSS